MVFLDFSSNMKLRTDVVGDIQQVICSREFEGLPSFNSQNSVPLKGQSVVSAKL